MLNGEIFRFTYFKHLDATLQNQLKLQSKQSFQFRILMEPDLYHLSILLNSLEDNQKIFFEAHAYHLRALRQKLYNPSFFMMGVFDVKNVMVGYFLLRCFINKQCFVGRMVHEEFRGKGIGRMMNRVMYEAAWEAGFRVFATLSPKNKLVMQSHKKNPYIKTLKDLPENYKLVEFVKPVKNIDKAINFK